MENLSEKDGNERREEIRTAVFQAFLQIENTEDNVFFSAGGGNVVTTSDYGESKRKKKEELGNRGRGSIDFSVENSGGRETKIHTQGERET
ncbi:hypothetical protein RUM43_000342 [Polyplax serrata]|uniref:Uncharacterized protein n=1 Tax=Polyplax serrata TaxID=468196 RepID=A0AAN8SFM7_POLSC